MILTTKAWFDRIQTPAFTLTDTLTRAPPIVPWITTPLAPTLRHIVRQLGRIRRIPAQTPLFARYENIEHIVITQKGVSGRFLGSPYTQATVSMAVAPPGCLAAGNLNLFTGRAAIGRYITLTKCEMLFCRKEHFLQAIHHDPALLSLLIQQLELINLSDRLGFACASLLTVDQRFQAFLLAWSLFYGCRQIIQERLWIEVPYPISRRALANILRCSPKWLDTLLKHWQNEERIQRQGSWLWIRADSLNEIIHIIANLEECPPNPWRPRRIQEYVYGVYPEKTDKAKPH